MVGRGTASDPTKMKMKTTTTLPFAVLWGVILTLSSVVWTLQGGPVAAPVMDCDETFNYVEALHYLEHGTGMQTWEYAAQYGLRSWFYVCLHALPGRILRTVLPAATKLQELIALRVALHVTSCLLEAVLCSSVQKRFGSNAALLAAVFLGFSSGMGHARRAFLPSSTCMMAFTLAQAMWMRGQFEVALLAGSFSVLVSWPFSALPFIPIGLHALNERGIIRVVLIAILALVLFGLFPALIDSYFYGKMAWPTAEMILYNALGKSGGGAHLYGVEPWTFYPKNLFLNFNILTPLAFLAVIFGDEKLRMYHGLPLAFTLMIFQFMGHKEERFLFMIYPTICWSAAVLLAPTPRWRPLHSSIRVLLVLSLFLVLSVSRNLALARLSAPGKVFENQVSTLSSSNPATLCMGREWHRFPSSYFLPENISLQWTRSNFKGILPQAFAQKQDEGYSRFVPSMNDMNKEETSRYIPGTRCDFVVDSNEPYQGELDELRPSQDLNTRWNILGKCEPFGEIHTTSQPYRSFAWLLDPWKGVTRRDYCLYQKL